ncbi:MAG: SDR family oxidoreductase, partial [Gammaproteobacteria bacterium]|nr:SDR family oxidoreductase [Gammaproteobacteria bacterium]
MNIVITGSTKGIGYGMAREFLKRGHNIMISSRRTEAVAIAVTDLGNEFPDCSVLGQPCDVAEFDQVEALWDAAERGFGQVDIWINNAGRDGMKVPFFALPQEDYMHTVQTNIVGLLHCNRVVIPKLYQQGGGMIWIDRIALFSTLDFAALTLIVAGWIWIGWRIENPAAGKPSVSYLMA